MSVRRALALVVGVLLTVGLTACTNGRADRDEPTASPTATGTSRPAPSARPKVPPVTVRDVTGQVRLRAAATRVVALDWPYAENLVAVGVQPVGVADRAGYASWVGADPAARLSSKTADVGPRGQPDATKIRALRPDLIVVDRTRAQRWVSGLRKIAPVLVFDPYRADMSAWEEMRTTFTELARAVGRSDLAAATLIRLDATIAAGRRDLAEAGKADMPFALAEGYSDRGVPTLRMFARSSLASEVLERLGLHNDWKGDPDQYGFTTVGVPALNSVAMADFLYLSDARDNIFTGQVADGSTWKGLEFVRTGRVHRLGSGAWLFGGPLSAERCVREVVKALT
ncbi:ABC transporter substrate-binding protein [Actinopolymorpha pittospori]|uniref:Iron complex transport system substrate-binding protein n=1 Tax=Actinopolymorpha pittospori TaxID=648752 RepID=A0A927RPN4_9ACTN|nr:iron complex transport system substrate-binding protein [Actinopolymorpha pittospori]